MEKRSCGLCGRRFASGRALGGHMRSHMLFAPAPAKPPLSSSSEMDGPKQSADPEFSIGDGESEAESSIVPSQLLSPDATAEADVARSLMMLSRDTWPQGSERRRRRRREEEAVVEAEGRRRYQCDTCKRVFRSYHALGGHRAGHKKMRTSCVPSSAQIQMQQGGSSSTNIHHECPICYRVFGSAQALGGHKRSHLYPSASAKSIDGTFIDLNLPAAAEDAELSSVSDTKVAFMWR